MSSLDVLYYSLSVAIWVLIGLGVYLAVNLVRFMEHVQAITKTAFETAVSIQILKGGLKVGVLNFIQKAIQNFLGNGGGKRE